MRKKKVFINRILFLTAIIAIVTYFIGYIIAVTDNAPAEIFITENLRIIPERTPLIYAALFMIEMLGIYFAGIIGVLLIKLLVKTKLLFIIVGFILLISSLGLFYLAFFNQPNTSSSDKTGHVITFSILGIFILIISVIMIIFDIKIRIKRQKNIR